MSVGLVERKCEWPPCCESRRVAFRSRFGGSASGSTTTRSTFAAQRILRWSISARSRPVSLNLEYAALRRCDLRLIPRRLTPPKNRPNGRTARNRSRHFCSQSTRSQSSPIQFANPHRTAARRQRRQNAEFRRRRFRNCARASQRGWPGGGPGGPRMMNPFCFAIGASFATSGGGPSW